MGGLEGLALQGRWREVAKRCGTTTATDTASALSVAAYRLLALLKLKMNDQAAIELRKLGSFDDRTYISTKEQGSVSLVPFSLRVIAAELPWRQGRQQEAINRLYALLHWCAAQHEDQPTSASSTPDPSSLTAADSNQQLLWRRRHRDVLLLLVNRHCQLRQYLPALSLLDRLLQLDVTDVEAWMEAGLVQAMLGDLPAAQQSLGHVEQLLLAGTTTSIAADQDLHMQQEQRQRQVLVHRNRGLLFFLQRDYRGAAQEFGLAVGLDPSDAAAASNRAVSLMYGGQLSAAVAELEGAFNRASAALMLEPVITNMASLYELSASPASLAAKRRMADSIAAAAPDDLDLACTKTAGA